MFILPVRLYPVIEIQNIHMFCEHSGFSMNVTCRDKRRGCNNTIWAQNAENALLTISLETQVPTSQDIQEEFLNVRIID